MQLSELSQAMDDFVRSKGWYEPDSPRRQTPRNIAISLSLEAAEILEHFQWNEQTKSREELSGELADVTLYLLQLARLNDINLEDAVLQKLKINYNRTWDTPQPETERSKRR
ncbi:nucleotide pyrophosphohydrolase [Leptolinea tardivitalis]|uniref:Nucleotide pyrophosphohydrolase n=1 Tax=Leptolinea tardivitalis TaxID=229920 RepID=A0A0P6WYH9_9CHLR|nr:nucleotide pyrophosphohydrolase [Leptolinea tardivitalis]KPL71556.1 nucleotide pyrophosphohydrolase [Leptolinea tardivitalis]GAP19869.1 predicted pyrophosphatase [Leptolinea tardivitalis]